jgi:hypothetical protein
VVVNGSPADEQEARAARQGTSGDALWFRQDGKAYLTQDPSLLERVTAPSIQSKADVTAAFQEGVAAFRELERSAELSRRVRANAEQNEAELAATLDLFKRGLLSQSELTARQDLLLAQRQAIQSKLLPQNEAELAGYLEALARSQQAEELFRLGLLRQSELTARQNRLLAQGRTADASLEIQEAIKQLSQSLEGTARSQTGVPVEKLAQLKAEIAVAEAQLARLKAELDKVLRSSESQLRENQQLLNQLQEQTKPDAEAEKLKAAETLELLREAVKAGTAKPVQ